MWQLSAVIILDHRLDEHMMNSHCICGVAQRAGVCVVKWCSIHSVDASIELTAAMSFQQPMAALPESGKLGYERPAEPT